MIILTQNILIVFLVLNTPVMMYFRYRFRSMVYERNDWKIQILPYFGKELQALFLGSHVTNLGILWGYRLYLIVYLLLLTKIFGWW